MIVRHRNPVAGAFGSALDRSFDRTFDQLTSSLFESRGRFPQVEAQWHDDTLVLTVDLPGVPADSVSVEVAGRSLTLGAHTDRLEWSRSLQLGTSLDPAKVSARHLDGRLTVRIGAVDAPEARSIEIDTSPEPTADHELDTEGQAELDQSIETSSSD
ncbi:MAG: Hsp20/alpha crystallin family protein [Ilumatobacter sp.]|nr:MAG: Hsp20/alpha crystallin family protein [Ilumatobacter sp.]